MKKKATLLALIACVFALCLTALAVTGAEQARAEGETYTLTFEQPMCGDYDMASSTETWKRYNVPELNDEGGVTMYRDPSIAGGTAVNYAAGVDKYNVEVGKKYVVKYSVKSESVCFNFAIETPEWVTLWGGWVRSSSAYIDEEFEYTPSKSGSASIIFQFTAGGGDIYVKNVKLYEKIEKTVTAGEAIGELPAVPAKSGYAGVWTIDGEEITADTVLAENKTAIVAYKKVNTLTILPAEYNYDIAASAESWTTYGTPVVNDDGGVTLTRDASASGNVNYGAGVGRYTVTAGKTYIAEISAKADNVRFVLSTETPSWEWKVIPDARLDSSEYIDYKSEFTATQSGNMRFIFQLIAGAGNVYVKNFRVYEKIERQFESETAIGELPEIPEVEGYIGYWAIDGERITADTVYNYGTDKTATIVRKQICNISFVNDMYDYDMAKDLESWKNYNVPALGEEGEVVLNRPEGLAGGKAYNYLAGVGKLPIAKDKKYALSFDMKCDNIHMNIALDSPAWTLLGSAWFNNPEYVHYEYDYTATTDGFATVIFQTDNGSGNIYVKNLRFYEVEKKSVINGEAYGELPSLDGIAVRHGYRLCWTIDGKEIASDAVCEYAGNKVARISEIVLEDAHSIVKVEAKATTCEENGYNEHYACECGKFFTDVGGYNEIADINAWKNGDGKVAATGHNLTKIDGTAATCIEDGVLDHYNCENCNNNYADDKAVYKIANLGSWVIGEGRIPATGHTLNEVAATDPTCVVDGHSAYYVCSVCNAAFKDSNGENIIEDLAAWKAGEGSNPAKGHIAGSVWATDENKHWHLCAVCNEKVAETEAAHVWNDGVITTAATCKSEGEKTYTCTVCEKTKTEVVEKTAHTPSSEWTTDEDKHWHVCSVCNVKLDEAAHADENADGKCDVCGAEVKSDRPDVPEESDKPAESDKPGESDKPEDSKTSEISGGCFSGMNGALGMISLLIAAGAAVIIAKRGRKE